VLGINSDPVTIERIEYEIAERAFAEGLGEPRDGRDADGQVGGGGGLGPGGTGLRPAAGPGRPRGGRVRASRAAGGLLRYGIPEFKMEKAVLDRRLVQLEAEGVTFRCATSVGVTPDGAGDDGSISLEPGERRGLGTANAPEVAVVSAVDLLEEFDALVLAGGATLPRDLPVPGRGLRGVHGAMEYLKPSNLVREEGPGRVPHLRRRQARGHHRRR
jgi:glutamate synthase (NADPH/NADH) small chain